MSDIYLQYITQIEINAKGFSSVSSDKAIWLFI